MSSSRVRTFPSVEALYLDDERRRRSGEVDFGVWWTDSVRDARWRVSWIEDTGEVYAASTRGDVRLYPAVHRERASIEAVLKGWPERCATGGLAWVEAGLIGPDPRAIEGG